MPGVSDGRVSQDGVGVASATTFGTATGSVSQDGIADVSASAVGTSGGRDASPAAAASECRFDGVSDGRGSVSAQAAPWYNIDISGIWVAQAGGRVWLAADDSLAGGSDMGLLVLNTVTETVPNASEVRLGMDFGNVQEILNGGVIDSFTVDISPTTSPPLTYNTGSLTVEDGYLTTAVFTGGTAGTYEVTFTPTLETGQRLPSRTGTLLLR